ncbi:MAG: methyltransferase domain-containing protein [Verrucomicrobiota bacterium]
MIFPREVPSPAEVASHYDELDWFYRDAWGEHLHHGYWKLGSESATAAIVQLQQEVADLAEIRPGDQVCDIGCGYGAAAMSWAKTRGAMVTGITISERQWEDASRRARQLGPKIPRPSFLHGDWLENSLKSNHFDAVVSIECLSHVENKPRFLEEASRVVKPGGAIALCVWTARRNVPRWAERRLLEPICREGRFAGLATREELEKLIAASGMQIESLQEIGPEVKKTWRVIFGRLVKRVLMRREYREFLWKQLCGDRRLVFTVLRVWIAFEAGMLNYALVKARLPV